MNHSGQKTSKQVPFGSVHVGVVASSRSFQQGFSVAHRKQELAQFVDLSQFVITVTDRDFAPTAQQGNDESSLNTMCEFNASFNVRGVGFSLREELVFQ